MIFKWLRYKVIYPGLLAATVLTIILCSPTVLRVATSLLQWSLPGQLTIEETRGRLLDGMHFTGIDYRQGELQLSIQEANLYWLPHKLLALKIVFPMIQVKNARIEIFDAPIFIDHLETEIQLKPQSYLFKVASLEGHWKHKPIHGFGTFALENELLKTLEGSVMLGQNYLTFSPRSESLTLEQDFQLSILEPKVFHPFFKQAFGLTGSLSHSEDGWMLSSEPTTFGASLLQPWLPPGYYLKGEGKLHFGLWQKQGEPLQALAQWQADTFGISYLAFDQATRHFTFKQPIIRASLHNRLLEAMISLEENPDNFLKAAFKLGPSDKSQPFHTLALNGNFDLQLKDLSALSLISPEVSANQGSLTAHGELKGNLQKPEFKILTEINKGQCFFPLYGTQLKEINLKLTGSDQDAWKFQATTAIGKGLLAIQGNNSKINQWTTKLDIKGHNLQVADTRQYQITASPDLKVEFYGNSLEVEGKIVIPKGVIRLAEQSQTSLSQDVRFVDSKTSTTAPPKDPFYTNLDIALKIDNALHVQGYGLDAFVGGKLRLFKRMDNLWASTGHLMIKEGQYKLRDKIFSINQGRLIYPQGTLLQNPSLDIRMVQQQGHQPHTNLDEIGIYLQGTLQKPQLQAYSNKGLSQDETLSQLGFGSQLHSDAEQKRFLMSQATSWITSDNDSGFSKSRLQKALGLEELNLESRDVQKSIGTEDASTTVLVFGKRLSSRLYMQYIQGVMGDSSDVRLEYKLSPRFAISVDTGTVDSGMDILWSLEKD